MVAYQAERQIQARRSTRWFLGLLHQRRAGCQPELLLLPVHPRQQVWLPRCSQRQLALASPARKLLNSFRFCGSTNPRSNPIWAQKEGAGLASGAAVAGEAARNILSAKSWFKLTAFLSKREQVWLVLELLVKKSTKIITIFNIIIFVD